MLFVVSACQCVQMGHQAIQRVEKCCTAQDAGNGNPNAVGAAKLQRRHNQPKHSGSQHDTGGKAQHGIVESMGNPLNQKTDERTDDGGAAYTQCGDQHKLHNEPPKP